MEKPLVSELNERSREIFRLIVDSYVATGEAVGSRTLSRQMNDALSPATIRNVMADLQDAGLLFSPHTSAGRLPTEAGLRLFVNGFMEFGALSDTERSRIESECSGMGRSVAEVFEDATQLLSGLSRCASLVIAPKTDKALKHIEFVHLGPGRALVVMVSENGLVENRIISVPPGMMPSSLVEAGNYLNSRLTGRTVGEAREAVLEEITQHRAQIDELTQLVVENGIATLVEEKNSDYLIVRGQANLLEDVTAIEELEHIRHLLSALETREGMVGLLEAADSAEGVQIFIGSGNNLFSMTGCSMVVSPFRNEEQRIVGAIGVVGPTRINYARIIPMVDYTAKMVGEMIGFETGLLRKNDTRTKG